MSLPKESGYTLLIVIIWMLVISLIFGSFFYTKINYQSFFNKITNLKYLSRIKILPFLQATVDPTLNEPIEFYIDEKFTNDFDGPHTFLNVSTRKNYPCVGYSIHRSVTLINRQIFVDLGEIQSPGYTCPGNQQPASFSEDLFLDDGDYSLDLKGKGTNDKYYIKVSTNRIIIENDPLTNPIFSTPTPRDLIRIPKNLIEVRCFYNSSIPKDSNNINLCQNFFGESRGLATAYITPPPDTISINQYYIYRGDDQLLINKVKKYQRLDTNYYLSISTWEGKKFTCNLEGCQTTKATFPTLQLEY